MSCLRLLTSSAWRPPQHLPLRHHHTLHHVFGDALNQKALDKTHRAAVANAAHQWHKYNKPTVELDPSVRNWLVMIQNDRISKRRQMPIEPRPSMPTPFKPYRSLEPVMFHQLSALTLLANWPSYREDDVRSRCHASLQYLNAVGQRLGMLSSEISKGNDPAVPVFLDRLMEATEKLEQGSRKPSNNYDENDPKFTIISAYTHQVLSKSLSILRKVSQTRSNDKYSLETELVPWTLSLASPTVTSSCQSLQNLTNIPPFVLGDILLRTPMSANELDLQLDIWSQFKKQIVTAYVDKPTFLKTVLANTIFYTIAHNPRSLPRFVNETVSFINSPLSGVTINSLGPSYMNELVWDVAATALLKVSLSSSSMKHIIKTQEVLVGCINNSSKTDHKTYQNLTLKSHMGIALAMNSMSTEKALQLMSVAEKRFFNADKAVVNKDMVAYNITRVYLSTEPEELVENFNSYAVQYCHSTALWLSFVKRLQQMGLLTENRSIKILGELAKIKRKVVVSKDIVSLLIKPVRGLNGLHSFILALEGIDKSMILAHSSTILPKYMAMLYRNHGSQKLAQNWYPWDPSPAKQELGTFKGFPSVEDYARYLYTNCIKNKSPRVVGAMLQGESISSPESVYTLYQQQLINRGLFPDRSALAALIRASAKPSKTDSCIMWGNLYAPQVAIHEFGLHVKQAIGDPGPALVPDDSLWQQYIRMLSKFDYSFELSEIFRWWERLHFSPKHSTLMLLLGALPSEHSKRHILHMQKVKSDNLRMGIQPRASEWNWPTADELERYKAAEGR